MLTLLLYDIDVLGRQDADIMAHIDDEVENVDTTGVLWVEKYAPRKYTELLSDEVGVT